MNEIKTTGTLTSILAQAKPSDLTEYLEENRPSLFLGEKPFAAYMRERFNEKKIRRQEVFLRADLSEGYGYKLISEEKHTVQRDVILRLCLGGRFTLLETQRALRLYGMSPLYAKVPRDAVLMVAIDQRMFEASDVDELLKSHGMEPLYSCRNEE